MIAPDEIANARSLSCVQIIIDHGHLLRRMGNELIGPCPRCGGTDRFAISLRKNLWHCRGCQKGGDSIALTMHLDGVPFQAAVERLIGPPAGNSQVIPQSSVGSKHREKDDADRTRRAQALWRRRQPGGDSPGTRYLQVRGYCGPIPATLGYLPAYRSEQHPALIAAFGSADEREQDVLAIRNINVKAVHLTFLQPDGSGKADAKPNKIMIGPVAGSPIVLAPMNDALGLAITEGIEDGLSIYAATRLGVWTAGSASLMPHLANLVPDYTDAVTIVADDDRAGRLHAPVLAARLRARGIHVEPIVWGFP